MRRQEEKAGGDEDGEEGTTHNLQATFDAAGRSESGSTTGSETESSVCEDKGEGTWADRKHTHRLYAVSKEHHFDEYEGMLKALRLKKRAERHMQNEANESSDKRRHKKARAALLDLTMQFKKKESKVLRLAWKVLHSEEELAQMAQLGKKRGPKPVVLPKPKAKQVLPQLH